MKLSLVKGTTSKSVEVVVSDSSSSVGGKLIGLAYNTASLTGYYRREGESSATSITLASSTLGTWTSGAFKEVSATNMPGAMELGIPDACLATGAGWVHITLKGAANMAQIDLEIELTAVNNQSAAFGLALAKGTNITGFTDAAAAPSAAANATAVRTELATELGRIDASVSSRMATFAYTAPPSAAANATAVRTELTTELGRIDAAVSSRMATFAYTAPPSAAANATAVRTELTTELGRIDAAVSSRMATFAYTAPPSAAANASAVRTELTTELGRIDASVSSRMATFSYTSPDNTGIAAIKAKTDNLPSDPADESLIIDATTGIMNTILSAAETRDALGLAAANLDTALAALATASALGAVATEVGKIPRVGFATRWTNQGTGASHDDIALTAV
ncbi:MAG: hypothetical protein QOE70_4377 [Chthoniobacter sp.]|jgi:hypothetical protein|nr:hypothetical protein [Chthoniobacter sp.]